MKDLLALVARCLIALLFLLTVWLGAPSATSLGNLGLSPPLVWSLLARAAEIAIVISLVLGLWVRWGALIGIAYVIVATALAHRFWQAPDAQFLGQYTNFSKNAAILGGLILIYIGDAGAYVLDRKMSKR